MENQEHNRKHEGRDAKGRWLVGYAPNPTGKTNTAGRKGFASWRARVEALDDKFPTFGDLMQFFRIDKWGNPVPAPAFLAVNPYDAGLIWQKILSVFGKGKLSQDALESFWDRYEGTPTQTIKHQGLAKRLDEIPTHFSDDEAAARAFEDLLRTNGL